jgi:hypothetical protein
MTRAASLPGRGAGGARIVEGLLVFCRGEIDRAFLRPGCLKREGPGPFRIFNALRCKDPLCQVFGVDPVFALRMDRAVDR